MAVELDEPILPDEYPVYASYMYVADGKLYRSNWSVTVRELKRREGFKEVRRCDIFGRQEQAEEASNDR